MASVYYDYLKKTADGKPKSRSASNGYLASLLSKKWK